MGLSIQIFRRYANLFVSAALFALILSLKYNRWPSLSTYSEGGNRPLDATQALELLSVLLSALTVFNSVIIDDVFEELQWLLIMRKPGLRAVSFLSISPMTSFLGALRIALWIDRFPDWVKLMSLQIGSCFRETGQKAKRVPRPTVLILDRVGALFRVVLILTVWLCGILLLLRTEFESTYQTQCEYNATGYESTNQTQCGYDATAGVGKFNGSMVDPFIELLKAQAKPLNARSEPWKAQGNGQIPLKLHPPSTQAVAYNLVTSPKYSTAYEPVSCTNDRCQSFLLSGGGMLTTPWTPDPYNLNRVVVLKNVISRQLEFMQGITPGDSFKEEDCKAYNDSKGISPIAAKLCLAHSKVSPGFIIAGIYPCPNDGKNIQCDKASSGSNTTLTVYNRTADLVISKSNYSILSILDVGEPHLDAKIDLEGYKKALGWLLNFTDSNIPAEASMIGNFWAADELLQNDTWAPEIYPLFQNILAFPLWLFHTNNVGNVDFLPKKIDPNIPPDSELRTVANISLVYKTISIDETMFWTFVGIEVFLYAFVCSALIGISCWRARLDLTLPETSSFPAIDFALKSKYRLLTTTACKSGGTNLSVVNAGSASILAYLGALGDRITYRTDSEIVEDLGDIDYKIMSTDDENSVGSPAEITRDLEGNSVPESDIHVEQAGSEKQVSENPLLNSLRQRHMTT